MAVQDVLHACIKLQATQALLLRYGPGHLTRGAVWVLAHDIDFSGLAGAGAASLCGLTNVSESHRCLLIIPHVIGLHNLARNPLSLAHHTVLMWSLQSHQ
eukprot:484140-Pelagomonas_calceolata.AAC.9